ncbi:E3 ubiquitin-protein ligase CCNB1IP1 homolog isoform X2 [Phragmites australis]|uniref:E3 ubiquitin-protein ligase CCNB1IP1 homolog isoform X2 n=1 Tax=Phragmites australis TaxID=29695 RepID=UPI002D79A1AD|nr:E3 ubiquitin-protein ligase CCNB1IP1 homolog isoform X2 [Phragmites australis]
MRLVAKFSWRFRSQFLCGFFGIGGARMIRVLLFGVFCIQGFDLVAHGARRANNCYFKCQLIPSFLHSDSSLLNLLFTRSKMKCNACWRELEGQAVSTTCGHLLCTEDAKKILSNDGACPICDQVLSKSHMRPMDINPSNDWTNMAMAGVSPQILMKSAYRSVMFYIGQKELEMQYNMNRIVDQCRQKCVLMQAKFTEKLEEVHSAYQKMAKRCQLMEQEVENLTRDKQELQEKFAEKSRQKRKLDEMYDQLRSEYESVKRSSMEPTNNFFARPQPDLFTGTPNMMDGGDPLRQGRRDEGWGPAPRQGRSTSGPFKLSAESHVHAAAPPVDIRPRQPARRVFGAAMNNPSAALRDLIISPVKRPQLSRNREPMFAL